jgi:hypothetical protein
MAASWDEYIRTTEFYKAWLPEWNTQHGDADRDVPTADEIGEQVFTIAQTAIGFDPPDEPPPRPSTVRMTLHCGAEPIQTNGQWDESGKVVTWEVDTEGVLPGFCFAVWTTSNEAAQQKHFGRVVLRDDALSNYALWYHALSTDQRAEWDTFVAQCKPGPDLVDRLRTYGLPADDAGARPDPPTWTNQGREGLLFALEDDQRDK